MLVEIGAACAKAGEYSEGAWLRIAERMRKLAGIVNQCADNVQTTDQEFKNRLEVMDFFATLAAYDRFHEENDQGRRLAIEIRDITTALRNADSRIANHST